jgi:hypothetical protein
MADVMKARIAQLTPRQREVVRLNSHRRNTILHCDTGEQNGAIRAKYLHRPEGMAMARFYLTAAGIVLLAAGLYAQPAPQPDPAQIPSSLIRAQRPMLAGKVVGITRR